jgi:CheY-like chemotaxis protein
VALRCLLINDDARFVDAAKAFLEGEGITIDTASTGPEAVRHISERAPDLVLLDIRLGWDSGFDVARQLHAAWPAQGSTHERARIILISTYSEDDFGYLIKASPVLGFIAKAALSARAIHELLDDATQDGTEGGAVRPSGP